MSIMKSIIVYENDDHKYNDHHDKTENTKSSATNTNVKNKLASLLALGMMTSPYNYINNKDGEDKE